MRDDAEFFDVVHMCALQTEVLYLLAPRGVRHGQQQLAAGLERAEQAEVDRGVAD